MRFCIYLDSFNEMPRDYLDDSAFFSDFAEEISSFPNVCAIIGSRTLDGLEKFDCPVFDLDDIDREYVASALQGMGVDGEGRFFNELLELFRKPFYFHLISIAAIEIPSTARPQDIYESLLREIELSVESRFEIKINLRAALSLAAYDAVDEGLEAFELKKLAMAISREILWSNSSQVDSADIVNWLVSKSLIIPHPNGLVSFIHQSVTEYLAAFELARIFSVAPSALDAKLNFHRWDQALFLTLGMLAPDASQKFISKVFERNLVLAINASKYIEYGQVELISQILQELIDRSRLSFEEEHMIAFAFERAVVASEVHIPLLRKIMVKGNIIGGVAAAKLLQQCGLEAKSEVLEQVYREPRDYNFCANGISEEFEKIASEHDVRGIIEFVENSTESDDGDDDELSGIIRLGATLLGNMGVAEIRRVIGSPKDFISNYPKASKIVSEALWDNKSTDALVLAGEFLLLGSNHAVVALSFIVGSDDGSRDLDWSAVGVAHAQILWAHILDGNQWALRVLRCQSDARQDVREHLVTMADVSIPSARVALAYTCRNDSAIFDVFKALIAGEAIDGGMAPLIKGMDIDWVGREDVLLGLIELRNAELAVSVIESMRMGLRESEIVVDIGDIYWWLAWLTEVDDFIFRERLGGFLAHCASREYLDLFVNELGVANSLYKRIIMENILFGVIDLTTDHLSRDAIDFLVQDVQENRSWRGHVLGAIATERFVEGRMLPLLSDSTGSKAELLRKAIRQAGDRLGRRFDLDGARWT